jgi:hypothetical protein
MLRLAAQDFQSFQRHARESSDKRLEVVVREVILHVERKPRPQGLKSGERGRSPQMRGRGRDDPFDVLLGCLASEYREPREVWQP